MPSYELRVRVPDRPGSLGVLALTLGRAGINIDSFDVVEVEGRTAIDQMVVDVEAQDVARAQELLAALPGVHVESFAPVARRPGFRGPLELAEELVTVARDDVLTTLVAGLPSALRSRWAVALRPRMPQPERLAGSAGAPSLVGASLPWTPVTGAVALSPGDWAPTRWGLTEPGTVAAAPLGNGPIVVLVARTGGPAFRRRELDQLGSLARIAGQRHQAVARPRLRGAG